MIFYIDIRSHGKEYERYYEKARQTGVSVVRSPPHTLLKGPEGHGVTMLWVDEAGTNQDSFFDLVILSVGLSNPESTKKLTNTCHIELGHHGFAKTSSFSPSVSSRPGIFVTGSFQSPKAIPQSGAVASTAAARAKEALASAKNTQTIEKNSQRNLILRSRETHRCVCLCLRYQYRFGGRCQCRVRRYSYPVPCGACGEQNVYLFFGYPGSDR